MNPRLQRAYRATRYEAVGIPVFIGRRSVAMDALLLRHGVRVGVFLTAWNPMSRRMPRGWNDRMQRALLERLRRLVVLPASGSWRNWREAHVLALGNPSCICRMARLFRQRAVVTVRTGQPASLKTAVRQCRTKVRPGSS